MWHLVRLTFNILKWIMIIILIKMYHSFWIPSKNEKYIDLLMLSLFHYFSGEKKKLDVKNILFCNKITRTNDVVNSSLKYNFILPHLLVY